MQSLPLFVAFSISLAVTPATPPGTNGAGENRKWTVTDSSPFEAEFVLGRQRRGCAEPY